MKRFTPLVILTLLLLSGCAKYELDNDDIPGKGSARLTLSISPFEKSDFNVTPAPALTPRAIVGVNEVCSRIGFAVFDTEGNKIISANQDDSQSANFGTLSANLNNGVYDVVIVGHSTGGNATITKPTEIKFKDNKVSDTFSYHESITIEGNVSKQITLKRSVAMFRLILNERIPEDVKQLKFYYTGGSSTLNAMTNYGSVNSRQTEIRDIPQSAYTSEENVFEIYSFPHEQDDNLKITITALSQDANTLKEIVLENVPITQGKITTYKGTIFNGSGGQSSPQSPLNYQLTVDDNWTEQTYRF